MNARRVGESQPWSGRSRSAVREIYMNRYIEAKVDDNPPPGLAVMRNIAESSLAAATAKMREGRKLDEPDPWGRLVILESDYKEQPAEVDIVEFCKAAGGLRLRPVHHPGCQCHLRRRWAWTNKSSGSSPGQGLAPARSRKSWPPRAGARRLGELIKNYRRSLSTMRCPKRWNSSSPTGTARKTRNGRKSARPRSTAIRSMAERTLTADERRRFYRHR